MSSPAEQPDPEAYFRSFPLELLIEPHDTSLGDLAIQEAAKDPRILPRLGHMAEHTGVDKSSVTRALFSAFLLGRQYEQAQHMERLLEASPSEAGLDGDDTEITPPAA